MGQYYRPALISEDGSFQTLVPYEYKNFPKLMEHSYIGNKFVNAVCTLIWKNPSRLAWLGDYSDDEYIDPRMVCNFFDGFLEEVERQMEEDIPGFNDANFFDYLPQYDTRDELWEYYCGYENELQNWQPEIEEAA